MLTAGNLTNTLCGQKCLDMIIYTLFQGPVQSKYTTGDSCGDPEIAGFEEDVQVDTFYILCSKRTPAFSD